MANDKKALTTYVRRLTSALLNAGVTKVVMSPGSRSTPLAYAFASTEEVELYTQIDERSAAYFALGLAKASGEAVGLLCTSGTAASNYFPAITEAHYARLPLVVMTADRPHELREVGAPQAIDQIHLYGNHVKYSVDFPIPEENEEILKFLDRHTQRAVSTALTAPAGPVHLNIPFREPLLIDLEMETQETTFQEYITVPNTVTVDERTADRVKMLLRQSDKGLIVVGELPPTIDPDEFWAFAAALNWPVLCDPLSNLRSQVPLRCMPLCIDRYDALLKSKAFQQRVIPDTVIRFGAQPVSKPLMLFLKGLTSATIVAVDESPQFRDPLSIVTHHIQCPPEALWQLRMEKKNGAYTQTWIKANEVAASVTEQVVQEVNDEGAYAHLLFQHLPNTSDLISGSSMPIRDVDTYFGKTDKDVMIFSNRGTNGIDGVVSTACGIQMARKRPTWLLIGDLSFLHDVNGLVVTRFHKVDLTIIIMNNDGGGIFSYLPQAESEKHFEELFGTPTGLTFEHVAAMYDAEYSAVRSPEQFEEVLATAKKKQLRIIEVFTDRKENVRAHRKLWQEITERLETDA